MSEPEPPRPNRNWLPWLIGALAVIGVVLVVAGRLLDANDFRGWQDPLYSVLLAFSVDGTFLNPQNPLTPLGALLIAVSLYLAVAGGVVLALGSHIAAFRARYLTGHIAVVGEGADSLAIARHIAADTRCVLFDETGGRSERNLLRLMRLRDGAALAAAGNLLKARAVIFDLPKDEDNAALALELSEMRIGEAPAIWAHVDDGTIAERVTLQFSGERRIEVYSDAELIARSLFARHPAHAAADAAGADRMHLLVVGFGALGEAIVEEAVYSGIAEGLGPPMVTIIDSDAIEKERSYRASRPAIELAVDMAFIAADPVALFTSPTLDEAALATLRARDGAARVTGIALCLEDDARNVRMALALGPFRRGEGRFFAPVFMRPSIMSSAQLIEAPDGKTVTDWAQGAITMEGAAGLIAADVLDRSGRDSLARALHDAYLEGATDGDIGSWNDIPETLRRANRKGADHLRSKLFSLGLSAHASNSSSPNATPQIDMAGPGTVDMLATLERRRWVADRVFDGWVPGTPRDDDRKVHPLLIGGTEASLSEADRQKDREQAKMALATTSARGDRLMRDVRIGLAGHRALSVESQASCAREIGNLLGGIAKSDAVTLVTPLAPGADLVLAEAAARYLADKAGALRLLVVEAAPYAVVLEVAARDDGLDAQARRRFMAEQRSRRAALFGSVEHVDIVRAGVPGISEDAHRRDRQIFETSLRRANAYLARRTDRLIVAWDGQPPRGPGGTGELVAWRRDPAAIPGDLDFPARSGKDSNREQLSVIPVRR